MAQYNCPFNIGDDVYFLHGSEIFNGVVRMIEVVDTRNPRVSVNHPSSGYLNFYLTVEYVDGMDEVIRLDADRFYRDAKAVSQALYNKWELDHSYHQAVEAARSLKQKPTTMEQLIMEDPCEDMLQLGEEEQI